MSYLADLAKRLKRKDQSESACLKLQTENCQLKTDLGVPQSQRKIGKGPGFSGLRFAAVPMKTCETSKHTVIK